MALGAAALVTPRGDSLDFAHHFAGARLSAGTIRQVEGLRFELVGIGGERWTGALSPLDRAPPAVTAAAMAPRRPVAAVGVGFLVLMAAVGVWWISLYRPRAGSVAAAASPPGPARGGRSRDSEPATT